MRFGVELELTALPKEFRKVSSQTDRQYWKYGYEKLRDAMYDQGISAEVTKLLQNDNFIKYPSTYDHWFVTNDSSVKPKDSEASRSSIKIIITKP